MTRKITPASHSSVLRTGEAQAALSIIHTCGTRREPAMSYPSDLTGCCGWSLMARSRIDPERFCRGSVPRRQRSGGVSPDRVRNAHRRLEQDGWARLFAVDLRV